MTSSEQFGIKLNNIQSSLKFFNFEGMDKDKVVEKYEETLCQREKQIRDIAYEIGIINEKLANTSERIKALEDENQTLHNKMLKKDTLLEQELTNKDIMFIKLNNLQNENDRLMKILQENGIGMTCSSGKEKKSFFNNMIDKLGGNKKKEESGKNIQMKGDYATSKNESNTTIPLTKSSTTGNNSEDNSSNSYKTSSNHSNINSSISATITQDLLNNINLTSLSIKKEDDSHKQNPLSTNPTASRKSANMGKNSLGRLSMQSRDKRLASENVDYEPVFK